MGVYLPPRPKSILVTVGGLVGLGYFFENYWYVAKVDGTSMKPALNPDTEDDYVLIKRCKFPHCTINRGDVVSLKSPKAPDNVLIKRVVGLPGDTVKTHGYRSDVVQVPMGFCWVEGDNIGRSMDSNYFGPIPEANIVGKATHIVWPLSRWRKLDGPEKEDLPAAS